MSLLFDSLFSSVALGHLIVDVLNAQRSILLVYLSVPLGLTNTTLAAVTTIYVWVASLSQPIFGWLSDRLGRRWLAAGGILWMASLFSLAMFLPGYVSLACLILASLGSAAFHPAGTAETTIRGRTHFAGRETTATSYFFVFGQAGYFFGPIIGGPLLDHFGPAGLLVLAGIALPIGMNAAWQLRSSAAPAYSPAKSSAPTLARPAVGRAYLATLALVAGLQAWAQQNMTTFVPKYLSDLGQTATTYGLITGLFMGGSALGNLVGGNLADRFGKRGVAVVMLALASIPLYMTSLVGVSAWLYLLVPLSGALTGAVHSILVVLAQRAIPSGTALASGLTLGFMFSAGALGTLLSGPLADAWGFPTVFQMTGGLALLAAVISLGLR